MKAQQRWAPWLVSALLVPAHPCSELAAQRGDTRPDLGVRSVPTATVEPLQIVGIVIDVESGGGVEAAQVWLPGPNVGAVTDSEGRFAFRAPKPGEYEFRVEQIGMHPVTDQLTLPPGAGLLVQVSMEPRPIPVCGLIVCGYYSLDCDSGVRVEVRAFDTGLAPEGDVTLTVRAGGVMASVVGAAPARDSVYLQKYHPAPGHEAEFDSITATTPTRVSAGGDLGSDGPFRVTVWAPGYATWTADDVWLEPRDCLAAASPILRVWLLRMDSG